MSALVNVGGKDIVQPRKEKPALAPILKQEDILDTVNALVENVALIMGQNQDVLERAVTFKDLVESGAKVQGITTSGSGGGIAFPPPDIIPPDLSTPPAVTGFTVSTTFDNALLFWDVAPYRNHAYVEIWRAPAWTDEAGTIPSTLADAKFLVTNPSISYADKGLPDDEYRYWIRNVSDEGIQGVWVGPVYAKLAENPAYIIDKISGEIRESDLYADLSGKIDGTFVEVYGPDGTGTSAGLRFEVSGAGGLTARMGSIEGVVQGPGGLTTVVSQLDLQINQPTTGIDARLVQTAALATTNEGTINASYTVKIDVGGRIAGFGLMNSGTSSEFAIRADRFWIAHPESSGTPNATEIPFIVSGGQVLIKNAMIDTAHINTLVAAQVTADYINAMQINAIEITGGEITIGNDFSVDVNGIMYSKAAVIEFGTLKGMQILDNVGGVIMTSGGGLNGAYINNLSVDTLKLAGNAVTVPQYVDTTTTPYATSATVVDVTYNQTNAAFVMAALSLEIDRGTDVSGDYDTVTVTATIYDGASVAASITHFAIDADQVGHIIAKHIVPINVAGQVNGATARVVVTAQTQNVATQTYSFKATGFITSAKR